MKTDDLIKYGLIAGGLYLAYQIWKTVSKVGETASDMSSQVAELWDTTADPEGSTFAAWYDPTQRAVLFYWLTFPDGSHHQVWPSSVDPTGVFTFSDGLLYRIGTDKAGGLRAYAAP